jgi:hypothetical protein
MNLENWRKEIVPIAIITFIAIFASSNGFQFSKLFFPADVLSDFAPWRGITDHDPGPQHSLLRDPVVSFEVWEELVRSAFSEHHWPLWNPYSYMGSPLLGNGQISAFTIFSIPLHFLSSIPSHFAEVFLKLCMAGVPMYFLARTLGLGGTASLVAGLTFMLSGHMMAWLHLPLSGGVCLAPLLLLAAERLLRKTTRLWFGLIVVTEAMLAVCGAPQTAFCIGLLLVAFSTYRLLYRWRRNPNDAALPRRALSLLMALTLGIGLASFQSLPFLEYLQQSAAEATVTPTMFSICLFTS